MRADIRLRPLIKLIPNLKVRVTRQGKFWIKYSVDFDWLIFTFIIDNF